VLTIKSSFRPGDGRQFAMLDWVKSVILVGCVGGSDSVRDDMAKVVTERPRRGHGNPSKKTTGQRIRRYDPDREYDEPTRLAVARARQYGYDCKEFSDLINPLKRYLRSCIGKPWKNVHSELSRKLDRRSLSGSHIWDHVMWEIETDCYIGEDRLAYSNRRTYH
jgi:hypothetical protein